MDLFSPLNEVKNWLPYDGEANYYEAVFDKTSSAVYLDQLLESIPWQFDEAILFGKHIFTKRKVAWFADHSYGYSYSKTTKKALPWTEPLLEIKQEIESKTKVKFNSCLLNLYHNNTEGMAWHSDGEKSLVAGGEVASVSFGAERKFCFKHKISKQLICGVLQSGSVLLMKGTVQQHWLHRLPPVAKTCGPRINLTFRQIDEQFQSKIK